LPGFVGGSWSYERISDWLIERAQVDREWHPEHSLSSAVTATGGAASLVATVGDGSVSGLCERREEMYRYLRNQVEKAIELLTQDEKASYIEALEKAPAQVWKEESNSDMFLRVEDFHARNGARRLCGYWRLRSESFGPKRSDSLYQTGEDAMGIRELHVM
jgi:hypothetical protein